MTRVLALHGFLGAESDWDAVKEHLLHLAPDVEFQTIALFENPLDANVAAVEKFKKYTLKKWAQELNQTQKSRHMERNILMGYSLGGRLALHAAIDKPGLWDDVVLVSAHPGLLSPEEKKQRKEQDLYWAKKFKSESWASIIKEWNAQPVFEGAKEPPREEIYYSREKLATALIDWSLAEQSFLGEKLIPLKSKLHWYAGEYDSKYLHLFENLKIDGFLEEYHVIKNASHRVIFDNPQELATQLVQDLKL